MKNFTAEQTARGIATTINRDDYSLAVVRYLEVPEKRRVAVLRALERALSPSELTVFRRYLAIREAK